MTNEDLKIRHKRKLKLLRFRRNLDREIKSKAENMIKSDRQRLEWEYKSKASAITKKYDTMTKTYYVELGSLVIFSLIATLSQVWKEPLIAEDMANFFSGLRNTINCGSCRSCGYYVSRRRDKEHNTDKPDFDADICISGVFGSESMVCPYKGKLSVI